MVKIKDQTREEAIYEFEQKIKKGDEQIKENVLEIFTMYELQQQLKIENDKMKKHKENHRIIKKIIVDCMLGSKHNKLSIRQFYRVWNEIKGGEIK